MAAHWNKKMDGLAEVRALLTSARPTRGSFEERRARWKATFQSYCPVPAGTVVEPLPSSGPAGEWVCADGVTSSRTQTLLYFHGGGYTAGSAAAYRGLSARLSAVTGRPVLAADYRLAPEHPFPSGLDDCVNAYQWLMQHVGVAPSNIVLIGDSCGGNFVITTILKLRDLRAPLPAAGVTMSGQFDMTLSGESAETRADRDLVISRESLQACAGAYIGTADRRAPLASPIFADFAGFPPLLLQVGSEEVLRDDNVRLAVKARAAGVQVEFEEWPQMMHVWHLFSDKLEAGRQALERIGAFVRQHTRSGN